MEAKKQKTVRFNDLVKAHGQPVQVTLWTEPEQNPDFMKAVRARRVVTVIQRNVGAQADYGLIGFFQRPKAAFLIFPQPLPQPQETKVIGIKYDAVAQPEPMGEIYHPAPRRKTTLPARQRPPRQPAQKAKKAPPPKKPKERPAPKLHRFRSFVELTAKQRVPIEVDAATAKEAAHLLRARARTVQLDPKAAHLSRHLAKPVKQRVPS